MLSLLLTAAALNFGLEAEGRDLDLRTNPVTKVVHLLKDMQEELAKEKKADEELYEQLECWCETNNKAKSGAVDTAQKQIASLTEDIEEFSAKAAMLKSE